MNKKLISSLLTVAMAINIFAIMPLNAFAIGSNSAVYEKDGYTVTYRIGSEWDNNRSVEVTIENTGDEAILNWALKYDTGGEVYNLWNSKIYDSTEDYTIIKNNGYNYEIEPGRSANYGYIVKGAETLIPENIELCCRRIDVKSGYDVDFNVTNDWYTGFQAEIAITNTSAEPIEAWTLDFDSNFDINNIWNAKLLSSEEQSYVTANQLWTTPINPGASASFGFTADKSATENAWAENFTLTAVVVGESSLEKEPEIDYELDTDSDGLPDYYEEIIGSDPKTEHSDDDQLPDGYEALYLGTDPSKSDSDDNGISDADEDFDTDGLTNLEEYNLGTDPFLEDSDYDTLSDKDEVNIHGTNPTKGDTDDDLVPDGDEVKLGLDPNSGSTNGTPDSERTFPQIVTAESEVLAAVNDDAETPFDVSLEITAAGVAESNVYARESGYSNAIENPSIIGIAPEFVYTDGLEVEEVTVKFELDDSIVDNTLGTYVSSSTEFEGIKRLNVFMFFEDVNMLLPVETFHDEATNTVYTTTDRMGTYCLVDMELFFNNLDIAPSDDEIEEDYDIETQEFLDEPVFSSYNISELKINTGYTEYKDNFDVAFVIDEVSYNESQLEAIKKEIQEVSEIIFKYSDNVTISVYGLNGYGQTHSSWYGRIDNAENINALLNKVTSKKITTVDGYVHISECIDYITAAHKSSESLAEREEYCFIFFNPLHTNSKLTQVNDNKDEETDSVFQFLGLSSRTDEYGMAILDRINREGTDINFSTITNSFAAVESGKYSKAMSEKTGGKNIDAVSYESVVTECIEHIYGTVLNTKESYEVILSTGLQTVELVAPITEEYAELAKVDEIDTSQPDTDTDGLPDYMEVNFSAKDSNGEPLIKFIEGECILPTYGECVSAVELTYVERGLYRFDDVVINDSTFLNYVKNNVNVLPVISDPTDEDGDGDSLMDDFDPKPCSTDNNGDIARCFSPEYFENYNLFEKVNDMYYDPSLNHGDNSIDFFYEQFEVNMQQIYEMKANIILLQQCLEYLGYLDMTNPNYNPDDPSTGSPKTSYGTFGGLTKSAVQLFQLNHRLEPLHANYSYDEIKNYYVDYNTLQMIISAAISKGFRLDNHDSYTEVEEYEYIQKEYIDKNKLPYFKNITSVEPVLTTAEKKAGVTIYSSKNAATTNDTIYYFDLTNPINEMFHKNAKLCHKNCFLCDHSNDEYKCTRLDLVNRLPGYVLVQLATPSKFDLYIWFFRNVSNQSHWNIKFKEFWDTQFNSINNNEDNIYTDSDDQIRFFHNSFIFYFNGEKCTPEILGNILLGFTGTACGFDSDELIYWSAVYSKFFQGGIESAEDTKNILKGVSLLENLKKSKETYDIYIH